MHLRLQDFKTVSEYNYALFKISFGLKLCGEKITNEDILEKMFTTFHAANVLLQQQYRERIFTKYSELISCFLVAEQNNELLMKNHQSRPTESEPFPEVNVILSHNRKRERGRSRGHGQNSRHYNNHPSNPLKRKDPFHLQKLNNGETKQENGESAHKKPFKALVETCYRCIMEGH